MFHKILMSSIIEATSSNDAERPASPGAKGGRYPSLNFAPDFPARPLRSGASRSLELIVIALIIFFLINALEEQLPIYHPIEFYETGLFFHLGQGLLCKNSQELLSFARRNP